MCCLLGSKKRKYKYDTVKEDGGAEENEKFNTVIEKQDKDRWFEEYYV